MFSKRVASCLVVLSVIAASQFSLSFAATQSTPKTTHSSFNSQSAFSFPSFLQAQGHVQRRGPLTPGERALTTPQKKMSRPHAFGAGFSSPSNPIFLTALDYPAGGQGTRAIAAGDVNGDGNPDLLIANSCVSYSDCSVGSVGVLLGNGDGTFQTVVTYSSGGQGSEGIAVGDVNGDGKLDILIANNCASNSNCSNGSVTVLLGNGDGTFQTAVSYSSGGEGTLAVAVGDVNGDGKLDLIAANQCMNNYDCSNGSIGILLGNGDGTFQAAVNYNSGGQSTWMVTIGDVNGDGKADLAVVNRCVNNSDCSTGAVGVLLGNGDGTFQTAVSYSTSAPESLGITIGDVNGDGHLDLVVANQCGTSNDCSHGSISVFLGNGDGTFQSAVGYPSGGQYAFSVALADMDGDGKADILVDNECSNNNCQNGSSVVIFKGNGDGTFSPTFSYASGGLYALSLTTVDVNKDGKPDVLMANQCYDSNYCTVGLASVLLSNGDGTLQAARDFEVNTQSTYSVAIGDVNGDGKLDLLSASQCISYNNCSSGLASVMLGNGDGTYQPAVGYSSGGLNSFSIAAADVNGDGKSDLMILNECADNNCSSGSVGVLLGNGDGTFQAAATYATGGLYSYGLAVGDVNGDGKLDVVATSQCVSNNCTNGVVGVLLGNGDGTFQPAVSYNTGSLHSFTVTIGDVNGDGKADLLVASQCADNNCTNGTASVLLGNGDGTFQPAVTYNSAGLYSYGLAAGDMNGDGKLDLVLSNQCSSNDCSNGSIAVLLGNGDGTFQPATTTLVPALSGIQSIVIADLNGDHKLDVASGIGNVLLLGNGDGTFQVNTLGAVGQAIAVGDLNGDGRPDLAVGGVTVLLNISNGFVFPTTTTLSASVNPSTFGRSVTFTATVTPQVAGIPTGNVTFTDGTTQLGTSTLDGTGSATLSIATLASGSHSITASYAGDTHFTGSTSTALNQIVQKADTSTALNSAPTSANVNQNVTLTALVSSELGGAATGTINFMDGTTQLGSSNLNGSGVATYSTSTLSVGTHSITAVYSGDSNFNVSTSTVVTVTVNAAGFSLSASTPTPASVVAGASAQSTITITPTGGFDPSTVNLSCNVAPIANPAATCSLSVIVVANGNGTSTLRVATTGARAALAQPMGHSSGKLFALGMLIPGMLLFAAGSDKRTRRKLLSLVVVFVIVGGCMLQMACGGASTRGGSGSPGTPAGTYTVTVTGAANGAQQTTSVSLTVQ